MKKVIYIVFAVFAIGLASCSKQDIQPNSTSSDAEVPVWKSLNNDNNNTGPIINEGEGGITDPELGGTDGASITDPELEGSN